MKIGVIGVGRLGLCFALLTESQQYRLCLDLLDGGYKYM